MADLLAELHAVLDIALAALEQDDAGHNHGATESYSRACDRLADAGVQLQASGVPHLVSQACSAIHDALKRRLQVS